MTCPRCGAQTEEDDRFCASCGATLERPRAEPGEGTSLRTRAGKAIGSTRRARLLTAGTAIAIVIAVLAFIALDEPEDESPDAYTLAADEICVGAKMQVGRTGRRSLGDSPGALARRLVPIVAEWRSGLNALLVPEDRVDAANALDSALRDVEVQAAQLSRLVREGNRRQILEAAGGLDEETRQVEEAIAELGLTRCERIRIAPGAPPPG